MQLTRATDYALRVMIYLAVQPGDRFVPTSEISRAYEISEHHLRKVTGDLAAREWVEARRGLGGGVRLLLDPSEVRLGAAVRDRGVEMHEQVGDD